MHDENLDCEEAKLQIHLKFVVKVKVLAVKSSLTSAIKAD